ncbi:MAG: sensor domain-containing diguanylate cyclase [Bermanella sp.]
MFILCLFFLVWQNLNQAKSEFRQFGFKVSESLHQSLVINETILDGFAAFLAEVGVQDPFRARFYSRTMMDRYADLYMFQAAQKVNGGQVDKFEQRLTLKMDHPIAIRRFEFGRGLISVNKDPARFYYPLVFVEPEGNNSFNMLGLDISSIKFVSKAMDLSLDSGLASISEGFELSEGDNAFVMIKPSLLPGQEVPDQYALLVVKSQILLSDVPLVQKGMDLKVRYENLKPMISAETESLEAWEQWLFPKAIFERSFTLGQGRVHLVMSQQFGLHNISRFSVVIIIVVCLTLGWIIRNYLRGHYQDELEQLKTTRQLYQRANYDQLTGLANRHYFEDYFIRCVAACQRRSDKFGILYVDLNDFKIINDTCGHATGDSVLTISSAILLDCVRADDVVCRFGGDEFVVLLSRVDSPDDVQKVIFRINEEMAKVQFVEQHAVKISASIGFSIYPKDGNTLEKLLHAADHKMYVAKRQGKVLSIEDHPKRQT